MNEGREDFILPEDEIEKPKEGEGSSYGHSEIKEIFERADLEESEREKKGDGGRKEHVPQGLTDIDLKMNDLIIKEVFKSEEDKNKLLEMFATYQRDVIASKDPERIKHMRILTGILQEKGLTK